MRFPRPRRARSGAARLLLETPDEPTLEEAQAGIRRALGDPTLELAYWDADRRTYVDPSGQPFELPPDSDTRVTTLIEYEGRRLAALVHDAALQRDEPELLEDVVATARVALEKDRTLRALRATQQRSRALLDAIPDNMFRVRRDGGYLDANIKNERYLPVPAAELPRRNVREILPPETADLVLGAIERALDTGEPQTIEYRLQRPVGLRDSEARIVASGPDEAVIIVRDITQRKQQEAALERERDFIQTVVNSAPGFFVVLDLDGALVRFNDTLAAVCGRPDDERVRGRPFWELFVSPDEADAWREAFARAVSEGTPLDLETVLVTTSGERRFVLWRSTPIVDENGEEMQLVTGDDVTERHHHATELERQRNFLNAIANNAPSLLCLIDDTGVVADRATNMAFERTLEYEPAETGGDVFWEKYVHPDDAEEVRARIERVIAGEPSGEHDNRWITSKGGTLVIAWSCTPLPQIDERRLFLVTGVDVTERKRQEEELRRERDFGHTVTDTIPSLLLVLDSQWRIAADGMNAASERLLGYCEDELVGKSFVDALVAPEDADDVRAALIAVRPGEDPVESDAHWLTYDGERRLVAWSCTALPGSDPPQFFLVSGLDITERRRQEEELRRSRARLVEAGDLERRRLERNLHDGAQQRLVSLSLSLRLARAKLTADPDSAGRILDGASAELAHALEELRELARGIHPAVLTDRGLGPALESLADRTPLPVDLERLPEERLPGPVEAAAFYVVSEALANVAKYAKASSVRVRVEQLDGSALVEVADDGVGGADPAAGSGLRGLADRVAALDGRLEIESPRGAGTRIRAEIPVGE